MKICIHSGYDVVFVNINREVIDALNARKKYRVLVKSDDGNEVIQIKKIRGVLSFDTDIIVEAFIYATNFTAVNLSGNRNEKDIEFVKNVRKQGIKHLLKSVCKLDESQ